jgi:hypothetical protein
MTAHPINAAVNAVDVVAARPQMQRACEGSASVSD